jgi:hypothetical protein
LRKQARQHAHAVAKNFGCFGRARAQR